MTATILVPSLRVMINTFSVLSVAVLVAVQAQTQRGGCLPLSMCCWPRRPSPDTAGGGCYLLACSALYCAIIVNALPAFALALSSATWLLPRISLTDSFCAFSSCLRAASYCRFVIMFVFLSSSSDTNMIPLCHHRVNSFLCIKFIKFIDSSHTPKRIYSRHLRDWRGCGISGNIL